MNGQTVNSKMMLDESGHAFFVTARQNSLSDKGESDLSDSNEEVLVNHSQPLNTGEDEFTGVEVEQDQPPLLQYQMEFPRTEPVSIEVGNPQHVCVGLLTSCTIHAYMCVCIPHALM